MFSDIQKTHETVLNELNNYYINHSVSEVQSLQANILKLLGAPTGDSLEKNDNKDTIQKINSILCSTIRGGYVSYAAAETAAEEIGALFYGAKTKSYDILCKYARGKYCSYATAYCCAEKIASII